MPKKSRALVAFDPTFMRRFARLLSRLDTIDMDQALFGGARGGGMRAAMMDLVDDGIVVAPKGGSGRWVSVARLEREQRRADLTEAIRARNARPLIDTGQYAPNYPSYVFCASQAPGAARRGGRRF